MVGNYKSSFCNLSNTLVIMLRCYMIINIGPHYILSTRFLKYAEELSTRHFFFFFFLLLNSMVIYSLIVSTFAWSSDIKKFCRTMWRCQLYIYLGS